MAKKAKTVKKTVKKEKDFFSADSKHLKYAAIVLILVAVLFWAIQKGAYEKPLPVGDTTTGEYSPKLEDGSDLDTAVKEMDGKDLNLIDNELKQLDSDSSQL